MRRYSDCNATLHGWRSSKVPMDQAEQFGSLLSSGLPADGVIDSCTTGLIVFYLLSIYSEEKKRHLMELLDEAAQDERLAMRKHCFCSELLTHCCARTHESSYKAKTTIVGE